MSPNFSAIGLSCFGRSDNVYCYPPLSMYNIRYRYRSYCILLFMWYLIFYRRYVDEWKHMLCTSALRLLCSEFCVLSIWTR